MYIYSYSSSVLTYGHCWCWQYCQTGFILLSYCFVVVSHLTLCRFTFIGAHHICICGEIYSLAMLFLNINIFLNLIERHVFLIRGFFASTIYLSFTISLSFYHIFISVTYLTFSVPLARFILPVCIPYIQSSVHFHLLVVFVVLANKPLYNSLCVFNFSLCVYLFHFIDSSILLCFFLFQL